MTSYPRASADELAAAPRIDDGRIVLPLASQRMGNYCRWWLDSVAKMFVCGRSTVLRDNLRGAIWMWSFPSWEPSFSSRSSTSARGKPFVADRSNRFLRGRTVRLFRSYLRRRPAHRRVGAEMAAFLDNLIIPARASRARSERRAALCLAQRILHAPDPERERSAAGAQGYGLPHHLAGQAR